MNASAGRGEGVRSSMAGITFDNVTKTYGDGFRAVSDLNLEVQDGEFVVFVGPSGCGKTTALRMIAGLEEITGGEIRIGERVVNNLPPRDRDVAMVFQNYALYPHMTVAENIGFALRMRKVPKAERARGSRRPRASSASSSTSTEAAPALRRPAPARRDGPRDRARAAGVPDGRAALEPRREAARSDARRDLAHPAPAAGHDGLRDARPDRGDDDGRPHRGDAQRACCSSSTRRSASTSVRPTSSSRASSAARR